jgi:hypothetical protein
MMVLMLGAGLAVVTMGLCAWLGETAEAGPRSGYIRRVEMWPRPESLEIRNGEAGNSSAEPVRHLEILTPDF